MRSDQLRTRSSRRFLTVLAVAACLAASLLAPAALSQPADRYDDEDRYDTDRYESDRHDDSYDDQDEIRQTVARVSFTSGDNWFSRGDDPDDWQELDANLPMTQGDRVATADDGRLELQLTGGSYVRLDAQSDLTALSLTDETKQFSLSVGTASFQVRRLADDEIFEIDTPNAAVTFERAGEYRIDVDADGNTRVAVRRGGAAVAAGGGEISLDAGEVMDIQGLDSPEYDIMAMAARDRFDEWAGAREQRIARSRSYEYVSADVVGCEDLDDHGRWVDLPEYGRVWTPTVAAQWRPYNDGHWIWQDPWGWTWVAAEPWGWAPYHYGRWVNHRARWYWIPVARTVVRASYSPALVAFVGGGSGWSVSVRAGGSGGGGGYVGWFPLAPKDPFVPWWGSRRRDVTRTTNVTYVNRVHVTVVNQNTFVSGGFVRTNVVRDRTVMREVSLASVARGPIPLTPTRASLRGSVRTERARAPRRERTARAVVVRTPPPPAPLSFERKAVIIREGRGAPVSSRVEAKLAVEERQILKARVAVRPVSVEPGVVKLKSRRQGGEAKPPRPMKPLRGRRMATPERIVEPVSPSVEAPGRRPSPPGQSRDPEDNRPPSPRDTRREERVRPNPEPGQAPPPPAPAPDAGERERNPNPPPDADRPRARKPAPDQDDPKAEQRNTKAKGNKGKNKKKNSKKDRTQDEDGTQDGTDNPK